MVKKILAVNKKELPLFMRIEEGVYGKMETE